MVIVLGGIILPCYVCSDQRNSLFTNPLPGGSASTNYIIPFLCRFDPDRFAKGSPHARRGLEFCPFGTPSRRKCPGYQFSYFEVSIFTAILLNRFTLEAVEGQTVEKVHGLVTEPKEEIYMYIRPREDK